jgi:hypothetical protein
VSSSQISGSFPGYRKTHGERDGGREERRATRCRPQSTREAVLAAGDGEAEDPTGVVEEVEALGACAGGEAGDDADLAEAAGAEGVAGVLQHLGAVEAADDGLDGAPRGCGCAAPAVRSTGPPPRRSGGVRPPSASAAHTPTPLALAPPTRHRPHPCPAAPSLAS